jgi:hypothetical protein
VGDTSSRWGRCARMGALCHRGARGGASGSPGSQPGLPRPEPPA